MFSPPGATASQDLDPALNPVPQAPHAAVPAAPAAQAAPGAQVLPVAPALHVAQAAQAAPAELGVLGEQAGHVEQDDAAGPAVGPADVAVPGLPAEQQEGAAEAAGAAAPKPGATIATSGKAVAGTQALTSFTAKELHGITKGYSMILDEGGYGQVFKGIWGDRRVAVKCLKPGVARAACVQLYGQEMVAALQYRHPNIIQCLGMTADGRMILVYEYMSLRSVHQQRTKITSALTVASILKGTASALAFLHSQQPVVLHMDVKQQNILLDDQWNPKLADLGLATLQDTASVKVPERSIVTSFYMAAPELFRGHRSTGADVFALGVAVTALLMGESQDRTKQRLLQLQKPSAAPDLDKVVCSMDLKWPAQPKLARKLLAICRRCTLEQPSQRIAAG